MGVGWVMVAWVIVEGWVMVRGGVGHGAGGSGGPLSVDMQLYGCFI